MIKKSKTEIEIPEIKFLKGKRRIIMKPLFKLKGSCDKDKILKEIAERFNLIDKYISDIKDLYEHLVKDGAIIVHTQEEWEDWD